MPWRTAAGVLGIARTTWAWLPTRAWILAMVMPAMMESITAWPAYRA